MKTARQLSHEAQEFRFKENAVEIQKIEALYNRDKDQFFEIINGLNGEVKQAILKALQNESQ